MNAIFSPADIWNVSLIIPITVKKMVLVIDLNPLREREAESVKTVTTKEGQRTYSNFIVERGCDAV